MQAILTHKVSSETRSGRPGLRRPAQFGRRLFISLPLMAIAGFCLFGFVATLEPMPRAEQWMKRAIHAGTGTSSVMLIGWIWLGRRWSR